MFEIKFVGSGGHGVVVAAKLLADAAAKSGHKSQSFASYGALRRGGRVESYVRIDQDPILLHSKIYTADCLVLMEESLAMDTHSIESSVKQDGFLLVNTGKSSIDLLKLEKYVVHTVDANRIAAENHLVLGSGLPVINTTMLGAIIGLTDLIDFEDISQAIREGGVPAAEKNVNAARNAYDRIRKRNAGEPDSLPEATGEASSALLQNYPVFSSEKCNGCGICWMYCPDVAIHLDRTSARPEVNRDFCKGCGICKEECPRKAVILSKG